jgi:hypothetical protein
VWHLAQIREGAEIAVGSIIGRGAHIGPGAWLRQRCKVRNYALACGPGWLDDGVLVSPAAVFTNDRYPRAVMPDGSTKTGGDWAPAGATVRYGPSIGAGAVSVAPVTVGQVDGHRNRVSSGRRSRLHSRRRRACTIRAVGRARWSRSRSGRRRAIPLSADG